MKLWFSCLEDYDYNGAIDYWSEAPSQSDEYKNAQLNIAEVFWQRYKRTFNTDVLKTAYKHISRVNDNSSLQDEIKEALEENNISL